MGGDGGAAAGDMAVDALEVELWDPSQEAVRRAELNSGGNEKRKKC